MGVDDDQKSKCKKSKRKLVTKCDYSEQENCENLKGLNEICYESKRKKYRYVENFEEIGSQNHEISLKKKKKKKHKEIKDDQINCDKEEAQIGIDNTAVEGYSTTENPHNKKKKKKKNHGNDRDLNEINEITESECQNPEEALNVKEKKKNKKRKEDIVSNLTRDDDDTQFNKKSKKNVEEESGMNCPTTDLYNVNPRKLNLHGKENKNKKKVKNKNSNSNKDNLKINKGRSYTISIAIPASILEETYLLDELRTYVVGQIARTAGIYSIDEIIVYNDGCWRKEPHNSNNYIGEYIGMMKMILEYQECPQYLRRSLFPMHPFMRKAGVLNALNAPHHLLANEWGPYREGVVLEKCGTRFSYVDVGLGAPVEIDRKIDPGYRVTVRFPPEVETINKKYGYVVSPEVPRTVAGLYWGYTVRVAYSFSEVFKSDRFKDGYDLIIGTSDKGKNAQQVLFQKFSHALIVFGGVDGIEAAMKADENLMDKNPLSSFRHYLNVCPDQGSRTIRTEEAVLITLATLAPKLRPKGLRNSR